jgi:CRISPR/Cas system-associated protein Cas10 (large subunit of type III CRISPR-Cas system)
MKSQGQKYPKDVSKTCKHCGRKRTFRCENRSQRDAFYFCCDSCVEAYYFSTCKTETAARSKIGLYYSRKGMKWEPGKNYKVPKNHYHHDRESDRLLMQEIKEQKKIESPEFKRQLKALDAEYRKKLRQSKGLRGE